MEDVERAQERLQHIRSVAPILDALRMVSLGSWQKARKRWTSSEQYSNRLLTMLPHLLPHLPHKAPAAPQATGPARRVVVVAGSERGLCARFNMDVVDYAEAYLDRRRDAGESPALAALGGRVVRLFVAAEEPLAWSQSLSVTSLPPLSLAFSMTRQWLAQFEKGQIDAVTCIHNAYEGMGRYEPTAMTILPPELPGKQGPADAWPPPIVETDPVALYTHIVQQWTAVSFYLLLLESAMAEHSLRYQVLDSATQNVERLTDDLSAVVQAARQQTITREMQSLAVAAGLIGGQDEG